MIDWRRLFGRLAATGGVVAGVVAVAATLSAPVHAQQNDPGDEPGLIANDDYELPPELRKQMVFFRSSVAADVQAPDRVFGFFTITAGLDVLGVRLALDADVGRRRARSPPAGRCPRLCARNCCMPPCPRAAATRRI